MKRVNEPSRHTWMCLLQRKKVSPQSESFRVEDKRRGGAKCERAHSATMRIVPGNDFIKMTWCWTFWTRWFNLLLFSSASTLVWKQNNEKIGKKLSVKGELTLSQRSPRSHLLLFQHNLTRHQRLVHVWAELCTLCTFPCLLTLCQQKAGAKIMLRPFLSICLAQCELWLVSN